MSNAKKNQKNQTKPTQEELAASLQALLAQGKKEGMIRSTDLNALLEKMELSTERIEDIYDSLDAMNIQVISPELDLGDDLDLVALDGDRVAGYVGSQTVMDESDMMNVAVHPDYRKQGIATALIVGLVEELRKKGSHCLTLEVRASNENAISLYKKLDFQEVGRRKNYYRNPREDALIMRKEWEI